MRLIDADAFWKPFEDEKEELENRTIKTSSALTALKFIDFIKRRLDIQPTILQPERKKGRWLPDNNCYYETRYICSECKLPFHVDTVMMKPSWRFCPRCGARMEGAEE